MLIELAVFVPTLLRTPAGFRRHVAEAVGLWARGRRQAKAWVPHIANMRGQIDLAIDEMDTRRTVVVLGSGPLFDVPLESLARTFETVILVDRVHLTTIDPRVRRYANVRREWRDLSVATTAEPLAFLSKIENLDWVLSMNLLSQLALAAPEGGEQSVIASHVEALAALPCRATLFSDVDYRVVDRTGTTIEERDLLYGYAVPAPDLGWKWEVAPFGEEAAGTRRVHRVSAWLDWRRSSAG